MTKWRYYITTHKMDSRLIHNISVHLTSKVEWEKAVETEWIYCGAEEEVKYDLVQSQINDFFSSLKLYVAIGRRDSFETDKHSIINLITDKVGRVDLSIWSDDFESVIEFNKIGVFRKGKSKVKVSLSNS